VTAYAPAAVCQHDRCGHAWADHDALGCNTPADACPCPIVVRIGDEGDPMGEARRLDTAALAAERAARWARMAADRHWRAMGGRP
jgi:hypothetical protein